MQENNLIRCMAALYSLDAHWLITPVMHKKLCEIVESHVSNQAEQHAIAAQMPVNPSPRAYAVTGDNVAIIPVDGVIGRKFSSALYSSGVTSVDVFTRLVDVAANDDEVNAIMLVFDSPGGSVQGVKEAGEAVKRASAIKPVIAYADGQMASAAYWIGSQASAVYSWTESSIGSIGVYSAFLDQSRAYEMAGLKPEIFKSGKHKGMGMAGTSLTDEQRAMIQKSVDEIGSTFRAIVKEGRRNKVSDETMQGQSFSAQEAMALGLIDSISTFAVALADAGRLGRKQKEMKGQKT